MSRKSKKNKTYEESFLRLQEVIRSLQYGDLLSLDQSLNLYQEAIELLQFCYGKLDTVEQQLLALEEIRLKGLKIETDE